MPHFSALIPETHWSISAGYVETLIQTQREELSTGLMRLSYPSGENLIFSFLEGVQKTLYRCLENRVEVVPKQTWRDALDRSTISVGFIPLPLAAMPLVRLVHEAPIHREEQFTLNPEELAKCADLWAADQEPSIVLAEASRVRKYCLFAGYAAPVIEQLSFASEKARFDLTNTSFPQTLQQTDYRTIRYVSQPGHPLWREYELRLAFSPLMRILFGRFGELAGRVLTERLCEQLSAWVRQNAWNMTVTSNGIVNHHYFDSLESAARAYMDLLRCFREEASPAIGARMVDSISREILIKLDPYRRGLLVQYIFDPSGVGSLTGVVWR